MLKSNGIKTLLIMLAITFSNYWLAVDAKELKVSINLKEIVMEKAAGKII